jgi:hypothetical protein
VHTTLLSKAEFQSLLAAGKVENVTGKEESLHPTGVIDIAPYVRAVPSTDLAGYKVHDEIFVDVVYRTSKRPFDLVHVMTKRKNVYLVVVIDVENDRIHGHHLLDLNDEYGLGAANDA